jgi:hypothetical protein
METTLGKQTFRIKSLYWQPSSGEMLMDGWNNL